MSEVEVAKKPEIGYSVSMKAEHVLHKLGYTPNETKIYLASLKIGAANVTEIAQEIEMPRSTVKELVVEMHKKGLLNYYMKRSHKMWFAQNPEILLEGLREKEASFEAIIPMLRSISVESNSMPKIRIFSGLNDIKMILDDIIATKHHINAVVSWDQWIDIFGADYINDFIITRASHNLKIRLLSSRTSVSLKLKEQDQQHLRQTRFLPAGLVFDTTNFFYGNKTALISLNKKHPVGLIIEDDNIAKTMNIFFECLWSQTNNQSGG